MITFSKVYAIISIILLLNAYNTACASDWVFYGTDSNNTRLFFDKTSLTKNEDGTIRSLDKQEYNENKNSQYDSITALVDVDCKDYKEKIVSITIKYKDINTNTLKYDTNDEWLFVAPDSIGHSHIKAVCTEANKSKCIRK